VTTADLWAPTRRCFTGSSRAQFSAHRYIARPEAGNRRRREGGKKEKKGEKQRRRHGLDVGILAPAAPLTLIFFFPVMARLAPHRRRHRSRR